MRNRPKAIISATSAGGVLIIWLVGIALALGIGLLASSFLSAPKMGIVWPMLAAIAIFLMFSYSLWTLSREDLLGEIGFVYLALVLAYTVLPAVKFLRINFDFPAGFDAINFSVLKPLPSELSLHFWRHTLFMGGMASGYLAVRSLPLRRKPESDGAEPDHGKIIFLWMVIVALSACAELVLSKSPANYVEHYTRYSDLTGIWLQFVNLCSILKNGGYFVLLALMFSQYRRYRRWIFVIVAIICAYEVIYSLGSRLIASTILLGMIGFYHFRVRAISLRKGISFLIVLALLFTGIAIIRASDYDWEEAKIDLRNNIRASEFDSVFATGFHLFTERDKGTLPPRDWRMAFYELFSIIPFIDHKAHLPQYWYARNYFPQAVVPQTNWGILADSAIWGGEIDLLARSLLNGILFALLARWFLLRRRRWAALTVYVYCYATCMLTIKYSVLYQLTPLVKMLVPVLLMTAALNWGFKRRRASTGPPMISPVD